MSATAQSLLGHDEGVAYELKLISFHGCAWRLVCVWVWKCVLQFVLVFLVICSKVLGSFFESFWFLSCSISLPQGP